MKSENQDTQITPGRETGESLAGSPARVVSSHELLGRQRRLQIDHGGERYVLRVTRQGKLILTK
ncbi:hemin uptake protein HemP [Thioalkalivibrio sulfidiphilus]|uniref:hemin uptake protein HemP n=1 Tax=Thioalkalivibrio sulfidiphilus TaxID=1033854 RepID=UPI00039C1E1D|nr:hemin uptake protein HemP [Thioalkalivibrio sulfidiphilus]